MKRVDLTKFISDAADMLKGQFTSSATGFPYILKGNIGSLTYSICYFPQEDVWRIFWPWEVTGIDDQIKVECKTLEEVKTFFDTLDFSLLPEPTIRERQAAGKACRSWLSNVSKNCINYQKVSEELQAAYAFLFGFYARGEYEKERTKGKRLPSPQELSHRFKGKKVRIIVGEE